MIEITQPKLQIYNPYHDIYLSASLIEIRNVEKFGQRVQTHQQGKRYTRLSTNHPSIQQVCKLKTENFLLHVTIILVVC